jgi:hypothetical protein
MLLRSADDKMKYYENLAEMYVGDDVSPDFYGWVFPKYDHVAVGTGKAQHCRAAVAAACVCLCISRASSWLQHILRVLHTPDPRGITSVAVPVLCGVMCRYCGEQDCHQAVSASHS